MRGSTGDTNRKCNTRSTRHTRNIRNTLPAPGNISSNRGAAQRAASWDF
jgi:hypothetical protein